MARLVVTVSKLNKRSRIPSVLPESVGISGVVMKGFKFEGQEITSVPNPSLGKWYRDRDGSFYWGGGLIVEAEDVGITVRGLPANLPGRYMIGVDVSHHNDPDWNPIKGAGVTFCYIKISEGVGTPDPKSS